MAKTAKSVSLSGRSKKKLQPSVSGIVEQEYELVPVKALQPHPRNCNEGDLGEIITSIRANQFFGAVVAQRSTGNILAGTHRWRAAQSCEIESIPTIWLDVDDATALRIMLVDNRTARLGHDDPAQLSVILQEMLANQGTLDGTGYTCDYLDELLADLGNGAMPDFQPASEDEQGRLDRKNPVICPNCHHEFTP